MLFRSSSWFQVWPGEFTASLRPAALAKALAVGSRGQLQDHIALGVADLNAWIDKLRSEGVTFLEEAYPLGDTRAVMIEGPSREALELVEVK